MLLFVGRDNSVGIATSYGLDGPGMESRWGRDFPHPSRPFLGPTQPPVQWVSFPGVKRPGRGVDHPPPSCAEVKGRIELYLYSPSGPSWPVLVRRFMLFLIKPMIFGHEICQVRFVCCAIHQPSSCHVGRSV